jgi:hypothetical protein
MLKALQIVTHALAAAFILLLLHGVVTTWSVTPLILLSPALVTMLGVLWMLDRGRAERTR